MTRLCLAYSGLIQGLRRANVRRHYKVSLSLAGRTPRISPDSGIRST